MDHILLVVMQAVLQNVDRNF